MTKKPAEWLCACDLASVLGVSRHAIHYWTTHRWIPKPQKRGQFAMHKVADVVAAIKHRNLKADPVAVEQLAMLCQPPNKVPA